MVGGDALAVPPAFDTRGRFVPSLRRPVVGFGSFAENIGEVAGTFVDCLADVGFELLVEFCDEFVVEGQGRSSSFQSLGECDNFGLIVTCVLRQR